MSFSTSVVDDAGPASNAPQGARHRCRLQNSVVDTVGPADSAPQGGPPSTSSLTLVVDTARPVSNAPRGPIIDAAFKLSGGRSRTCR
jgi:cell division septation protein DedD